MHAREEKVMSYRKVELIVALKKNLENHEVIVKEAEASIKGTLLDAIDVLLNKVEAASTEDLIKNFPKYTRIRLDGIEDHRQEYKDLIALFGASTDETVELTQGEFQVYFLDRWHWRGQFMEQNSRYSATARKMR